MVVSTPDHTHAVASVMAMKLGKHVYCEKPLTHSVYEARVMRETAARYKVATQMGNQGTASERPAAGRRGGAERGHRPGPRSARLDQPADLAAGPVTADGHAARARATGLGRVAGAGARAALQSGLSPVQMARLVGLWHRSAGRHGLPHGQPAVHGLEARRIRPASRPNRRKSTTRVRRSGRSSATTSRSVARCRRYGSPGTTAVSCRRPNCWPRSCPSPRPGEPPPRLPASGARAGG